MENSTIIIPPLSPSSKELQKFDSCCPINPDSLLFFLNLKVFLFSHKMGKAFSFSEKRMRAKKIQTTWPTSLGPFIASFLLQSH